MPQRKKIELKFGCAKKLAADCQVAPNTVKFALNYVTDTELAEHIRKTAYEKGYVKEF